MVVPIFAPMMIGIALSRAIASVATSATTNDVVVELLCNMAVMSNPMKRPVNGLDVANNIVSATFFFMCCNEDVIRSSAKRNNRNAPRMYRAIRTLLHALRFGSMGGVVICSNLLA